MTAFHYRDGWYFERLDDGSVLIKRTYGHYGSTPVAEVRIDPASWASIIAHLARLPETGGEVDSPVRAG
mgnify:FL=1